MKKNYLQILLILVNIGVIFYINYKIETDLSYHSGKDGGVFTGLQMIVILSSIYFLVLGKRSKIISVLIGFIVGILSFLISYFTLFVFLNNNDIYFYLVAMIIFVLSFHLIEKKRSLYAKKEI